MCIKYLLFGFAGIELIAVCALSFFCSQPCGAGFYSAFFKGRKAGWLLYFGYALAVEAFYSTFFLNKRRKATWLLFFADCLLAQFRNLPAF